MDILKFILENKQKYLVKKLVDQSHAFEKT